MSKYRATPQNFLPPPNKQYIQKSKHRYTDEAGTPWLFDSDWPQKDRPRAFKQWAIFDSNQWSSNWLIVYTLKVEKMPQAGDVIILKDLIKPINAMLFDGIHLSEFALLIY